MQKIAAFEAKTRFGELLDRVIAGEEIVITRHEKPVARIVPEGGPSMEDARRAAAGLEGLQREIEEHCKGKRHPSWPEFKSFAEEGRR
jgi:prevent-host-death family protein